jgi:hypothetical protein
MRHPRQICIRCCWLDYVLRKLVKAKKFFGDRLSTFTLDAKVALGVTLPIRQQERYGRQSE